jgi:hypothetical protein
MTFCSASGEGRLAKMASVYRQRTDPARIVASVCAQTKTSAARSLEVGGEGASGHVTRQDSSSNTRRANALACTQYTRQTKMQTPSGQSTSHGAWNSQEKTQERKTSGDKS